MFTDSGLPIMQGKDGRAKQQNAELVKGGIMLTTFGFYFKFTSLGMLNKIWLFAVTSQILVFAHKCRFYKGIVEDQSTQMTLTGQEARIQIRYWIPDHPQVDLFKQMCEQYKNLSEEQLLKNRRQADMALKRKMMEQKLDDDFTRRLKELDGDMTMTMNTKKESKK